MSRYSSALVTRFPVNPCLNCGIRVSIVAGLDQALDVGFQLERALIHGAQRRADQNYRQMAVFTDVVSAFARRGGFRLVEALLERATDRLSRDRLGFLVVEQRVRGARDLPVVA